MKKLAVVAIAVSTQLTGCLLPEKFTARVDLQNDASYTFQYTGTVVYGLAAMQLKDKKPLTDKDNAMLKAEAEKLSKSPDIKRAVYKGDGRFELDMLANRKPGEILKALDVFTVSTGKDNVMTITSGGFNEKDKQAFKALGIVVDGKFEVKVPKDAEIISHNATSTPSFFGMFGTYSWKVGNVDQLPIMKIKFKK